MLFQHPQEFQICLAQIGILQKIRPPLSGPKQRLFSSPFFHIGMMSGHKDRRHRLAPPYFRTAVLRIFQQIIMERIKLNGEKEYSFNKTYSLPSKPEEYELKITAIDNFVEANRKTQKIKYIVSSEMVTLFLADVPKGTDLTADVCGVPMLYHKKSNGIFTFKYYADCDNKEIYFLGQESAFEPHCFGVSEENGKLLNSPSAAPIVLPTKGYYEIVANTKEQTYTVTPYIPSSAVHDSPDITMCGYGFEGAGWDPSNKNCLLTPDAENPYILGRTQIGRASCRERV